MLPACQGDARSRASGGEAPGVYSVSPEGSHEKYHRAQTAFNDVRGYRICSVLYLFGPNCRRLAGNPKHQDGEMHIVLHVSQTEDGIMRATFDSVERGANGILVGLRLEGLTVAK